METLRALGVYVHASVIVGVYVHASVIVGDTADDNAGDSGVVTTPSTVLRRLVVRRRVFPGACRLRHESLAGGPLGRASWRGGRGRTEA